MPMYQDGMPLASSIWNQPMVKMCNTWILWRSNFTRLLSIPGMREEDAVKLLQESKDLKEVCGPHDWLRILWKREKTAIRSHKEKPKTNMRKTIFVLDMLSKCVVPVTWSWNIWHEEWLYDNSLRMHAWGEHHVIEEYTLSHVGCASRHLTRLPVHQSFTRSDASSFT